MVELIKLHNLNKTLNNRIEELENKIKQLEYILLKSKNVQNKNYIDSMADAFF